MKAKHPDSFWGRFLTIFCFLAIMLSTNISMAASISGSVYDTSVPPLAAQGVGVQLITAEGQWVGLGSCSDLNGYFMIADIPAGRYILTAGGGPCDPFAPKVYAQTFYTEDEVGTYDRLQAYVFDLGGSESISGIDYYLVEGATISGLVTIAEGAGPVNISANGANWGYGGCTEPDGTYSIVGLPPGSFRISSGAQNFCGGQLFKQVFFNNKPDWNSADLVTLAPGELRSDVNFLNMSLDAAISGTISGQPGVNMHGINVVLHDSIGRLVAFQTLSDWTGYYFGNLIPDETYTVKVYDPFLRYVYAEQSVIPTLGDLATSDFLLNLHTPSGIDPPIGKNPMAFVVHLSDGSEILNLSTEIEDPSGCQPASIKLVYAIGPGVGPNGRPHYLYHLKYQALVNQGESYGESWQNTRDNQFADMGTQVGSFQISVLDTEGNRAPVSTALSSYVQNKLPIPVVINPDDLDPTTPEIQVDPANLTLSWNAVQNAAYYQLRILYLGERIFRKNLPDTSFQVPEGVLSEGCWYSWQVMAFDSPLPAAIDYASVSPTNRFYTLGGIPPASEPLSIQIVPWVPNSPLIPHDAYAGRPTLLKAVAKAGTAPFSYSWDFGDGSNSGPLSSTNRYNLEASHSYPSGADAFYEAQITVTDSMGATASATYPVRFWKNPSRGVMVNVAIDDALWWLHKVMNRFTSAGTDYGMISPTYNPAGTTALALQSWVLNGHRPDGDPGNPYAEDAMRAKNYILSQLFPICIGPETIIGTGVIRNPDANGNGLGLYAKNGHRLYETGLVLMALATLKDTSLADTVQDLIDYLAYAQVEPDVGGGRGGWRYDTNYRESDMSVTQFPLIGLEAAEYNLGGNVTIPAYVKNELKNNFLYFVQNKVSGGFGYSWPQSWVNVAKTGAGLVGLALTGIPFNDPRTTQALSFIENEWFTATRDSNNNAYFNIGDLYTMYAVMKGMKSYELKGQDTRFIGSHDWYDEYSAWEIQNQQPQGYWQSPVNSYGPYVDTAFGILILLPQVFEIGPTAVAKASPTDVNTNQYVTFDHSESFHRDPTKAIVQFEWDFNGDGLIEWSTSELMETHPYRYTSPGTYQATLTVTDSSGIKDTDQVTVDVSPVPSPVAVNIRIEPETINLSSKGVITAFITLPEDCPYALQDIDSTTLVCEGAGVKKTNLAAKKLIAKFNTEDLVGVPTGDAIILTVTGAFLDGTPFEGSDTVRVINKKK